MVIGLVGTWVGDWSATTVPTGGDVVGSSRKIRATSRAGERAAGSFAVILVSRSAQLCGRVGGMRGGRDSRATEDSTEDPGYSGAPVRHSSSTNPRA
jgi:hypothetical protein